MMSVQLLGVGKVVQDTCLLESSVLKSARRHTQSLTDKKIQSIPRGSGRMRSRRILLATTDVHVPIKSWTGAGGWTGVEDDTKRLGFSHWKGHVFVIPGL